MTRGSMLSIGCTGKGVLPEIGPLTFGFVAEAFSFTILSLLVS